MFREINCITIGGEEAVRKVIEETPVAVFVNGRHLTTVILSPGGFQEFITGYLYTEEIARTVDDIESIRVEDNRISVLTKNPFRRGSVKKTILSGCGGSVSYIDAQKLPAIRSDLAATVPEIEAAIAALPRSGRLETVALAGGGRIIVCSNDLDRHNALDRVIGHGLKSNLEFSRLTVLSTGQVTSEMVRKCLVANIPVLVSTDLPTALAVDVAKEAGLCLVGSAGTPDMAVFTHPERISGIEGG
ncbi:formate dehydrogenase accessory sulfurtransferase FdhD [Methanoculleus receptaculi]|jgi:FdhD protein|uniref:Formate dehydrogenase accessory sulfurtransferase FdhD n=1 Tax=Methanoculleus receptaculi TaxID=394967 RepID=A0AAX4FSQ2_9EURY|nr:formate dehydrogenase accessory sulfurtransferase FdhD [Methanoculleus receptaculi]WOX56962.1 formate dehydrogenase accessory sulfurtransferase FdhD [Methanoculleus receptaculi]